MDVQAEFFEDVTILKISGEIDAGTASDLEKHVLAVVEPKCKLLLDMFGVEFMSSAGLRLMLLLYREVATMGGQIVLVNLKEHIKDAMRATGFLAQYTVAEDVDAGLDMLGH
jgi:anti-sigma B factor antagonist